jgi:hypothetical protein
VTLHGFTVKRDSLKIRENLQEESPAKKRSMVLPSITTIRQQLKLYISADTHQHVSPQIQSRQSPASQGPSPSLSGIVLPRNVTDKAPGDCLWEDVCHFIDPFLNIYEDYHIRELMEKSRSLPFQLQYRLLSPDFLGLLVSEWRTFPDCAFMIQDNNERSIQSFVHNVNLIAVNVVKNETNGAKQFRVISEPVVYPLTKNCLSDEAVVKSNPEVNFCEVLDAHRQVKILLEVKGTDTYPYRLINGEPMISQLLQQVALSRVSKLWKGTILAGLATHGEWNLFVISDCSFQDKGDLKLRVGKYYRLAIPTECCEVYISDLVSFISSYLLNPA